MKTPSLTTSLANTQREFFGALQFPLRGTSRRSTELPPCTDPHAPAFLATAEKLIKPTATLIPAECLELYHRQYWFRLLDSIEEDFPGLVRLLGKDKFWEVIEQYLLRHPSKSFTLRHLGRSLPDFIGTCISDPTIRRRATDISHIEWSLMASFEAPDAPIASPEQIITDLIKLQPHLILLNLSTNASDWLHEEANWSQSDQEIFPTAVWRTPEGLINHAQLEADEYAMLHRLTSTSLTLDQWLEASQDNIPNPETLTRWFSTWGKRSWFTVNN